MSRFQFRLQTLLGLRESERDQARQAVADAYAALDLLQTQIRDVASQRQQIRDQSQQQMRDAQFPVDALLQHGRYDLQLATQIRGLETNCQTIQAEIERREQALQAADIEVKRLERLRDQQREQWNTAQQAAQQRQIDELAGQRFHRDSRDSRSAS